jgi:hypothetical protein
MRTKLLTFLAAILVTGAIGPAPAAERSFGFIHVGQGGGVSQSLHSGRAGRDIAISGRSRHDSDRRDDGRRDDRRADRGFRDIDRASRRMREHRSFLYAVKDVNPVDRPFIPSLDDAAYGGSGTYDLGYGSGRSYGRGGYSAAEPASFPSEPKIIHIDKERLDRRPIGPSGIEVISTGGAKIIRIAPGYSSAGRRVASAEPASSLRVSTYLQPWSEAWMRHCIEAHADFNPDLGTYRDGAGRMQFCIAE